MLRWDCWLVFEYDNIYLKLVLSKSRIAIAMNIGVRLRVFSEREKLGSDHTLDLG